MQDVYYYGTRVLTAVLENRKNMEAAYERYSAVNGFWALVDLKSSSNYRIVRGPKLGYLRSEVFFNVVRTVIEPAHEVQLIKEIGDAVLLASRDFAPLFESLLLVDHVAGQYTANEDDHEFPFGIRSAMSAGPAKRLLRERQDYLGRAIDELARVMTVRSPDASILLHESAYNASKDQMVDYESFASVGKAIMLPAALAKGSLEPIYYREVHVARKALSEFKGAFAPWASEASRRRT